MANLIYEGQVEIGNTAGADPYTDALRSGKLRGLAALLEIELGDL